MDMLSEMRVFAEVVGRGGFSAAARQQGLTASAVSRHVARLEAHMGGRLLQRTTRSLSLTELGQQVHEGSLRMLAAAREVHALAGSYSERPQGIIRVNAPVVFGSIWLAPRMPAFLDRYPEIGLHLSLLDRTVDLIEEGADVGIRIAREVAPGLAARRLRIMNYVLIASPAYLAARGTPAAPSELEQHRCIALHHSEVGDQWKLKRGTASATVNVPGNVSLDNSAAVLAMVEAGGGIGLLSDFAADGALAAGRVVRVLPEWHFDESHARGVYAVYVPGRHIALKIRAFIDYLAAEA